MNVVIIADQSNADSPGGLNRYVDVLHAGYAERGMDSRLVVLRHRSRGRAMRVDLPLRMLRQFVSAKHAIDNDSVVDVHFALYGLLPVLVLRRVRRRLVVHFHGPWAQESALSGNRATTWSVLLKKRIEGYVYRRARRVVVLSAAFARLVCETYRVPPDRVVVIPPAVDLSLFSGRKHRNRASKRTFAAASARRLVPRMGLMTLLNAWGLVQRHVPRTQLVIIGSGPLESRLRSAAAELPRPAEVCFVPSATDEGLATHYRDSDCVVMPSLALEGFGLAALEALACGTPVIGTEVGGLPELLQPLDPTLVVPPGSPEALANRLIAAWEGELPDRRTCRQFAENFSVEPFVTRHIDMLLSL